MVFPDSLNPGYVFSKNAFRMTTPQKCILENLTILMPDPGRPDPARSDAALAARDPALSH